MSLEDLINTPFGQPMSARKRTISPRSAKYRAAARRIGKFTPEGRQLLLQGELMRMNEPNVATPESNRLMEDAETLKAAIATGGLDPAKDIVPLKRQFFNDVNASNLSAQDKEGIRQMFTDDLNKASQDAQAEEKRALEIQNQRFGVVAAQQGVDANKQLKELREQEIDIRAAQAQAALRENFRAEKAEENREDVADKIEAASKIIKSVRSDTLEDPESANAKIAEVQNDLRNLVASTYIDKNQLSVIDNIFKETGEETNFAREEIVKERDIARQQKNARENWFMNVSLNHPFNYDPAKSEAENFKELNNQDNIKFQQELKRGNLKALASSVRQKQLSISDLLKYLPQEEDEVRGDADTLQKNLEFTVAALKSMAKAVPEKNRADINKSLESLDKMIVNKSAWTKERGGRSVVDEEGYLGVADAVRQSVFNIIAELNNFIQIDKGFEMGELPEESGGDDSNQDDDNLGRKK